MALKGERSVLEYDISYTCESVADRGVILCQKTAGSGISLGNSAGQADLYASPSGKVPVGLLLEDVISLDETIYRRNFHKGQTKTGERCALAKKGRFTTDKITGTPTGGATAYLTADGKLTPTVSATGGTAATPKVGQFVGIKDEDGYVCVDINLPVV